MKASLRELRQQSNAFIEFMDSTLTVDGEDNNAIQTGSGNLSDYLALKPNWMTG